MIYAQFCPGDLFQPDRPLRAKVPSLVVKLLNPFVLSNRMNTVMSDGKL